MDGPTSPETTPEKAVALTRERGLVRARDFGAAGIARTTLQRLEEQGVLERTARGLYRLAEADMSANFSLAETALAVPKGVVALASALRFHELTTQLPRRVWLLMPAKAWAPTNPPVPLFIVRASETCLNAGVEHHVIDGVTVPITSPAKTVADCFKYRNRIGLDVAIEALRDFLRERRAPVDALYGFANSNRVSNVMRPYLEALLFR